MGASPYPTYTLSATMGPKIAAAEGTGKRKTREDTRNDPEARKKMAALLNEPLPDENRLRPGQPVLSRSDRRAITKTNKEMGASAEKALVRR